MSESGASLTVLIRELYEALKARVEREEEYYLCDECVHLTAEGYYCVDCKSRHAELPLDIDDTCPDFERAWR